MRKHLYKKKPCPGSHHPIELTEEVKNYILDNRVYHIPKTPKQTVINNIDMKTINYNNTMNNYIASIDPFVKIQKLKEYKQCGTCGIDIVIDRLFQEERMMLENSKDLSDKDLTTDDLLDMFDRATINEFDNVENINMAYEPKLDKIWYCESNQWKLERKTKVMKKVIQTIQDYVWNAYECYLIKKMKSDIDAQSKVKTKEQLAEYYTFLASIEIDPYVKDKSNNKIMYTPDDDEYWVEYASTDTEHYTLCDEFLPLYNKQSVNNEWRSRLIDCITRNSKRNVIELNKMIMSFMNIDEEFKNTVMESKLGLF